MIDRIPSGAAIKRKLTGYLNIKSKFNKVNNQLSDNGRFNCKWSDRLLVFGEDTATTGFDAHYVFHTAWAARILAQNKPDLHTDISSDLRFVTLVSAFVNMDFYDYRPVELSLSGLTSKQGDLMALPFEDNTVQSLSCMHVVEHIGLERYGEPLDPQGDLKAMSELKRVLAKDGKLFFVVPVGGEARIQYNAHRIYTYQMILKIFSGLTLEGFSLVNDKGEFIENASEVQANQQRYGCGCWLFSKK
jgi:SAM-dependent methyltransferase